MANVPADLRYTKDHEWAKPDGKNYRVGIDLERSVLRLKQI